MHGVRGRVIVLTVVASAAAAGCAGSSDAPSPTPQSSSDVASDAATGRPTVPPGDPASRTLRGTWQATDNDALWVTFAGRRWETHVGTLAGPAEARGDLSVQGDEIWLVTGNCPQGIGHYRWAIRHDTLGFTRAERPDTCIGHTGTLVNYKWKQVPS